jgi:hypothetical protein
MAVSTRTGTWRNRHPGAVLSDLQQAARAVGDPEADPGVLFVGAPALIDRLAEDGYQVHEVDGRVVVYPPEAD